MAGRRPKPTALKQLAGNPGKRKINQLEPKPSGIPNCPEHLDDDAREEWRRVSAELSALGLLTSVDRAALAAYCQSWSRWMKAEANIAKHGLVVKSPKSGFPIQNPFVSVANTALDAMRKFLVEFGMTPASRARLQVSPNASADPFAAFMADLMNTPDEAEETRSGEIH